MQNKINFQFYSVSDVEKHGCENIYSCCNQDVNSSGCIEICRKCGGKWGTNAKNCFKKNHNVVPIEIEVWCFSKL